MRSGPTFFVGKAIFVVTKEKSIYLVRKNTIEKKGCETTKEIKQKHTYKKG